MEASTLAGVATIVSVLAANAVLAGFQRAASEANMTAKDHRMKLLTEVLRAPTVF